MRGAVLLVVLAMATSVAAAPRDRKAGKPKEPAAKAEPAREAEPAKPRTPGPDDGKAVAILERIVAGPDAAARTAAIAELAEVAPRTIDAIAEWLVRPHATDVEARRAVLAEIKASVPDKSGRFSQPPRQTGKEQKADDEIDWQAELLALSPDVAAGLPGLGEVIADGAAIRALAATGEMRAAEHIFDTAFAPETMIYRDECGRYLRRMSPMSIPPLTVASMAKDFDRRRYATWQLERLDRQEPEKALDAVTGDEGLTIALLDAFRRTRHREAVHAVWRRIDDEAPHVRKAARAAWMEYVAGPPPPPAPMARLNLPGGKKTKKPKPLWLTYRELADNELRKAANELLGEDYPPFEDPTLEDDEGRSKNASFKLDFEGVTRRLFAHFDAERAKRDAAAWSEARARAAAGDLATATQMVDRMLAINPERGLDARPGSGGPRVSGERGEMARLYLAWGKQLEASQRWGDAAAAYSKAHGLDPDGAAATDALAAQHFALGKALEAEGKDGGPDFRRALALKPDHAPARTAAVAVDRAARPAWMLYAAAIAALGALALFAAAMLRRRA